MHRQRDRRHTHTHAKHHTAPTSTGTSIPGTHPRRPTPHRRVRVGTPPPPPSQPCDIYAAGGTPCIAAHSMTRALYAPTAVRCTRSSAPRTVATWTSAGQSGRRGQRRSQASFCANTSCTVTQALRPVPATQRPADLLGAASGNGPRPQRRGHRRQRHGAAGQRRRPRRVRLQGHPAASATASTAPRARPPARSPRASTWSPRPTTSTSMLLRLRQRRDRRTPTTATPR